MTKHAFTNFKSNDAASYFHRILGKKIYLTDIDKIVLQNDHIEGLQIETDAHKPVCIIDYKFGKNKAVQYNIRELSIKAQIYIADLIKIPFFIIETYLEKHNECKQYLVIPVNVLAKSFFKAHNYQCPSAWFSIKQYSIMQHQLRGLHFNPNEKYTNANLFKNDYTGYLSHIETLGELPDEPNTAYAKNNNPLKDGTDDTANKKHIIGYDHFE